MNTQEAKKIKDFTSIVRRDPDGTIVKVPGHNGRFYYVKVTGQTVTCRFVGKNRQHVNCPSTGSGTVCYHGLAAYEKVHGVTLWCESEQDAHRLENLGKHAVEVRSTQDGRAVAWAVLEGKPVSREDRDAQILTMAEEYLRLYSQQTVLRRTLTPENHERLTELRRQFGILKWNHSRIVNFVRDAGIETIERSKKLLGTDQDWAEAI